MSFIMFTSVGVERRLRRRETCEISRRRRGGEDFEDGIFLSRCMLDQQQPNHEKQPVVTRLSIFKGRRRANEGGQMFSPSVSVFLVLFLLLVHHVPFTTQKGSTPSMPQSQSPPRLIFANRRDIRIIDFYYRGSSSGSNIRGNTSVVVDELTEATALDIFYRGGVVCWSDIESEKIQCSSFNTTATQNAKPALPFTKKKTTIASEAVLAPEDLVCDDVTGNLYWTDSETNRLEVASIYPPFHRKVLIWDDIDQPRALALAPNLGLMFWTDWGEHVKIERASMDGTLRKVIVDKEVFWPNGIALDLFQEHLYWADAKLHYIGRVDFDGAGRVTINEVAPLHPFSLVYSSGFLFWSDWRTNSLHVMRSDGSNSKTLTIKQVLTPMDLTVFAEASYPTPIWQKQYPVSPCASSGCSHLCLLHSAQPYYKCACPIGIKLLANSSSQCSPEITNFLIVARGSDIRRISLDTEDFTDVTIPLSHSAIKHVLAVDYHVESGFIFWTDDEATRIKKAKLDGSQQQVVIKDEIIHPDGLVVDWVAQNLYWTDAGTDRIEVSRLDGTYRKILVSRGLQEPRAISVDPGKGFLFWSDWGKKAKIERSLLDGSERVSFVHDEIYWPNGIALDLVLEKIYWSDAKADRIEVCGYDGSKRRTVLQEDLPHIFGIALLGDHIYWTDWQRRSLERADKLTGANRMTIKEPFTDPMGIKGVNVGDPMWNITNPCKGNNGACEHLCFYKPALQKKYICACSSGYELSSDGRSCSIPDAFLVFSRDGDLHRISLNRTTSTNMDDVIPVSKVKAASALDFDTVESRIYWSDTKIKAIFRAFMNGSETEKVIEFGVAHPEGIAVDWLSRNIYWTDLERNRIEVAKLNGDHRRTVLWTDVDSPKSITLHPARGWMYYALWRTSNPSIEKAALDGTKKSTFVNRVGRANGLTIDLEESYLYWTDIDSLTIERCSLDGDSSRTRQVIQPARDGFKPFSLAQYQEYIYWSDMSSQTIQRAHKSLNMFDSRGGGGSRESSETPQQLAGALNVIDMAIYHKLKQVGWNPCSVSNCSHLCFSIPSDGRGRNPPSTMAQCGCPTHFTLSEDGTRCVPPKEYLLYSSGATISRLILDMKDCPDAVVMGGQSQKQRGISAIAWDSYARNIYWIDAKTQDIKKGGENGGGATVLLNYVDEVFRASDIVFDPVRQLLFWSCENYNSINVTDPTGKNLGSVLSSTREGGGEEDEGDTRPRLLALHPYNSHLYFSNDGKIERVKVDGMQRMVVVHGTHNIAGLAVDVVEGLLFWSDSGSRRIEMSDLEGNNRKLLVGGLDSPSSIAVMGRFLYWIEDRGGVERVDKYTGEERIRALPRTEKANHIVFINDSLPDHHYSNCDNRCTQLCVDTECSCFESFVLSMEDRRTCGYRLPCGPHEFSCSRGKIGCIPLQLKCNGKAECADGSDELDCAEEFCDFHCPCEGACFKPTCLKKHEICDGKPDCPGSGYDESELACSAVITQTPLDPQTHSSPLTTVVMPIVIIIGVILGAVAWYCVRTRQNQMFNEECTDPLNTPGTNMTTVNTAETLHQFASTNGSSSIGSSPYCDLLVPHPSPATEVRSFCCHGNYAMYYQSIEPAPPPTPCSTDVCDNSDIYAFAPPPSPHTSSPHSTIRSYPPFPPPPSPDLT